MTDLHVNSIKTTATPHDDLAAGLKQSLHNAFPQKIPVSGAG
jgi:hypothetical protein